MIQTANVAIGRFQPPTRAHQELIHLVMGSFADPFVFTTTSHDNDENPLDFETKTFFFHSMFPNVPLYSCTDAFDALRKLNHWGYERVNLFAGEDRTRKYSEFLKYVGQGRELNEIREMSIIDIGSRDPDAPDTEMKGVSASRARYEATMGDFVAFKQMLPDTDYEVMKELYNAVRKGLGLSWQQVI